VGARLRELRLAAGLTQAQLGGARFSKEYVSQVELGKTKPSRAALEWFAAALGTDTGALVGPDGGPGVAAVEAAVAQAEAELEAYRFPEAMAHLERVRPHARPATGEDQTGVAVRYALAHGWALHYVGRLEEALEELDRARRGALALPGGEPEQAQALYRLGVVRFKMGSLATSLALLDEALAASEGSERPSDSLRVRVFNARAKIRRRQKDFTAAAEDVEHALELARSLDDLRVLAETYLDASLVAERRHEYPRAREYAERAKALFEQVADREGVGKLLNNLGQLRVITGRADEALPLLRESFRIAVELDNRIDAAFAASTLASARLHSGDAAGAIESGERALELLGDRAEFRQEVGNARLVMGRAHLELGAIDDAESCFRAAADCFRAVESTSHLAGAWVALGDVAAERGDTGTAAALYRRAAEALQDVRW
jgi:tetratricopeptide (TPR) repeat protein